MPPTATGRIIFWIKIDGENSWRSMFSHQKKEKKKEGRVGESHIDFHEGMC